MAKTVAPTGLSITRNSNAFTCSWKVGDTNYDGGQKFWYRLRINESWQSWVEIPVTANSTSAVVNLNISQDYYPNTSKKLYGLQFCVRGKREGYDWSNDAYCTFSTKTPVKPTISSNLTNSNVLNISYNTNTTNTDSVIFMRQERQTMLLEESDEANGSNLDWSNISMNHAQTSSGNYTITEDSSVIAFGSHTRWFRMRTAGVRAVSDWAYTKHVYAQPLSAEITEANATEHSSGLTLDATWNAPSSASRPIDSVTLEYAKAVPIADMQPPANPSWQTGITAKDTSNYDSASINISGRLEADQCLFARVVTTHDNRNAYSNIALAGKGLLATPSGLNVSVNGNTATVRATNNSTACVYTGSDSSVKRQFLGITYKSTAKYTAGVNIGVIPTSANQAIVTIPERIEGEEYSIEVKSYVGTYSSVVNSDGVSVYQFNYDMVSEAVSTQGDTPKEPAGLSVEVLNGTDVRVNWGWSWDKAEGVEISWSQDEYAWQSNAQPDTFDIEGYATSWLIKKLETGKRYYLKARFKAGDNYSAYSSTAVFTMTTAPAKPFISISASTIAKTGNIVVSWNYNSTDGSEQAYAEIVSDNTIVAHSQTSKYVKLYAEDIGWTVGSHSIKVRVKSASGSFSEYSDTAYVTIAPELTAVISQTTISNSTLTALPIQITVTGAGSTNTTTVEIVRAQDYSMLQPDEQVHVGYEGELVCLKRQTGEAQISIEQGDILGILDDGSKYKIIATVEDGIGQRATTELPFTVNWAQQAKLPSGTVVIDGLTARITPTATASSGDVCDIYRLSLDKPELILSNGTFGETYLDPYPAIGGGYRIVFKTSNGDYITRNNTPAWHDIDSGFEHDKAIIDFGTDRVELYYNVDTNHSWEKDFVETKYLGGSVQGDWNPAVSRKGNISAVILNTQEEGTIKALRRLAEYSGICNVRSLDGSSYHANIDVNETRPHGRYGMISEFALSITRVDSQDFDAVPIGG